MNSLTKNAQDVLVIAANRERRPHAVAPLGAAHIAQALERAGHRVAFLDLGYAGAPDRAVARALRAHRPNVVALSLRNLDNCTYLTPKSFVPDARRLVDEIRQRSDATVVVGGAAVGVAGAELLPALGVSYGIAGEGERSLPLLLERLAAGESLSGVPGLLEVSEGSAEPTPPSFDVTLEGPGTAAARIDYRHYYRHGGFVSVQTKRGCPFTCAYCVYPALEGRRYRLRPAEACVDDIERFVKDHGLTDFFFSDSVFNLPRDHAAALCRELVRRELSIRWMAYCNPQGLDRELAQLFRASGCVGVELGLDAVTGKMIANLGKNFTQAEVSTAFDALRAAGLPYAAFLLFGGPDETWRDVEEAQAFLRGAGRPNAVMASLGIRIYRNTAMHRFAIDHGVVAKDQGMLDPVFFVSEALGPHPAARLDEVARRDARWTTATDWNGWVLRALAAIGNLRRTLPAWVSTERYGRHLRRSSRPPAAG